MVVEIIIIVACKSSSKKLNMQYTSCDVRKFHIPECYLDPKIRGTEAKILMGTLHNLCVGTPNF